MKATLFKTISALAVAALFLPAAVKPALAQSGHQRGLRSESRAVKATKMRQARLEALVGPEAAAQIKAARQAFIKETLPLRKEIRLARAELKVLLLKDGIGQSRLVAKYEELASKKVQLKEKALLNRLDLMRRYPDLSLLKSDRAGFGQARHRAAARKAGAAHRRLAGAGLSPEEGRSAIRQWRTKRLEFLKAQGELIRRIQLTRAQLKALTLDPAARREQVIEKYRHLADLTTQLGKARLLARWQAKQQSAKTAATGRLKPMGTV